MIAAVFSLPRAKRFAPMVAGLIALLLLGLMPLAAQAQLSQREKQQGASAHEQIVAQYGGVYDHPQVGPYVARITARMAAASNMPNEEFRVTVLNSPVVNAFALPGGYVYVTRGLVSLANSEAELASVIGQETSALVEDYVEEASKCLRGEPSKYLEGKGGQKTIRRQEEAQGCAGS